MPPKIKRVEFGNIHIGDETFGKDDVIIFWDGFEAVEKSHEPSMDEFHSILLREPDTVIFGTGFNGVVKISDNIKKEAKKQKIELIILPTAEAIKQFQESVKAGKKVVARIHTTC